MSIIASLATGYAAKSYLTPITPFHQPYVLHMADKPSPEDVLTCSRDPLCLSITQDDSSAAEADQQEGEQR